MTTQEKFDLAVKIVKNLPKEGEKSFDILEDLLQTWSKLSKNGLYIETNNTSHKHTLEVGKKIHYYLIQIS